MSARPSYVYATPDKMGGVASLLSNIITQRPTDRPPVTQIELLYNRHDSVDTRTRGPLGADIRRVLDYHRDDNYHSVVGRLYGLMGPGPGLLIVNDTLEMAMCHVHDPGRAVLHIVHDDWGFELATRHEPVIDAFVAHSAHIADRLRRAFPARHAHIFHLPYGVAIPAARRSAVPGPLRLIFIGRLTPQKGVHDLPAIDDLLRGRGVEATWTVIGDGPERERLHARWPASDRVRYASPASNAEVLTLAAGHDVFVFPTRFEGFPVALLEAMSVGLVPVASDLESGIPEVVTPDVGFRVPIGDCAGFADAIVALHRDRSGLESKSAVARRVVETRYELRTRLRTYHELFDRWPTLRREHIVRPPLPYGSRLDQAWIPNAVTRAVRAGWRLVRGQGRH